MLFTLKASVVGATAGMVEFFAATGFSNTITTGAILSTLVVVATAGFFTFRAQMSNTWKDNYLSEKTKREDLEEERDRLRAQIIQEREAEQIVRHDLKNQLAVAMAKTDLSVHESFEQRRHSQLVESLAVMQATLIELSRAVPKRADEQQPEE